MTLSDFATFSTAISGIAVTASIVYLAIQTRQNLRHTRALIHQGASARTTAIMLANQAPDSTAAWLEGNGVNPTPDAIKKAQFLFMCQTALLGLEDLLCQYGDGLMEEEVFARNCYLHRGLLSEPGFRAYWNARRVELHTVAPNFTAFVDGLCVGEAEEFKYRI